MWYHIYFLGLMHVTNFRPELYNFCNFGPIYDDITYITNNLIKKGYCHVKENCLNYYLTESLFKIVYWLIISIIFKLCN